MDPAYPRALGQVLRRLRLAQHLTQEGVDFASGIHRTSISQWERGVYLPSLENLVDYAKVLKVSPGEILEQAQTELRNIKRRKVPIEPPRQGRPRKDT